MAIPTIMGTEIEFGITVKNDPDFDPISSCVLIVNAYREDPEGRILWDYDQEKSARRRARIPGRGREVHAQPAGEHRPQQDADQRSPVLRRSCPPRVFEPRGDERARHRHPREGRRADRGDEPSRGEHAAARRRGDAGLQEQQRPQGQQLRLPRELPDGSTHVVQAGRRAPAAVLRDAPDLVWGGQGRQRESWTPLRLPDLPARGFSSRPRSLSTRW
jgi:hypothetical protein